MKLIKEITKNIMELSLDAIFIDDINGNILDCNNSALKIFGYTKEEMLGMNISDLVPKGSDYLKEEYEEKDLNDDNYVARVNVKKDGTCFPVEINSRIAEYDNKKYIIAFVRDMTEHENQKSRLEHLLNYDYLTELYNRRAIYNILDNQKIPFSVAIIDLDDFKAVNDTYGHLVGDEFLKHFGELVKEVGLTCGRIGGEEFLVIDDGTVNELYDKLSVLLKKCNETNAVYGNVTFSCGVSQIRSKDYHLYLRDCDKLLYIAKKHGKNKIVR